MDFSSIPAYLDPSNWQQTPQQPQQPTQHHGSSSSSNINPNPLLPPPPLPPPLHPSAQPPPHTVGGSIRPGSMAERARLANIPMPETALKCPRCESTNTKFCYFNNYSLSQPRHFCKTCRRYWTRNGTLRNVPVGGGCRRNKRSKSSSSASSSKSTGDRSSSAAATSSASSALSGGMASTSTVADILGLTPPTLSTLRFMSPLHHVTDFVGVDPGLSSYGGISGSGDVGFHLGSVGGGVEQWRIPPPPPQFPFLGGLDAAGGGGLYGSPFHEGLELSSLAIGQLRSKALEGGGGSSQMAAPPVKMEGSGQEMSLVRQFDLQGNAAQHYSWGGGSSTSTGNAWNDISGLNNSSCSTTSAM